MGVRHAKEALRAGEEHPVAALARKRHRRSVKTPFREAGEKRRTVLEEHATSVCRRRVEHPAVAESQTLREGLAPFVGVAKHHHVHATGGGREHHRHVALGEPRFKKAEHHVGPISGRCGVRIELGGVKPHVPEELHVLQRPPEADSALLEARRHGGIHGALRGRLRDETAKVGVGLQSGDGMFGEIILHLLGERTRNGICGENRSKRKGGNGNNEAFHAFLLFLISARAAMAENCGRATTERSRASEGSLKSRFTGSHSMVSPGLFMA